MREYFLMFALTQTNDVRVIQDFFKILIFVLHIIIIKRDAIFFVMIWRPFLYLYSRFV